MCGSLNGVVENFALGVDKATFIPLEGKDFMDPQYLSEGLITPGSHIQMVELFILSKVLQILSLQVLNLVQKKMEFLDEDKNTLGLNPQHFKGKTAEVGPLAKYIVVYTKVKQGIIKDPTWAESMIVRQIDTVSQSIRVPAHVWMPTMVGRTACRGLDAQSSNKYEPILLQ